MKSIFQDASLAHPLFTHTNHMPSCSTKGNRKPKKRARKRKCRKKPKSPIPTQPLLTPS